MQCSVSLQCSHVIAVLVWTRLHSVQEVPATTKLRAWLM